MKKSLFASFLLAVTMIAATTSAHGPDVRHDQKAMDVVNAMSSYLASMDRYVVAGETFGDAAFEDGLIITNPRHSEVTVDRSGSLYSSTFDGINATNIYIHEGMLTVYTSGRNLYARQAVPGNLQDALHFALNELGIETPFVDFLMEDVAGHFLLDNVQVIYVSDKSRIRGIDCHQIVLRARDYDLQLWIEEGDRPVVRKVVVVSILDAGMPRHAAFLSWSSRAEIDSAVFEFDPPDGAVETEFIEIL